MNYIYLHGFASSRHSFKGSILRKRFAELGKTLLTPDLNSDDFTHMTPSSQLQVIATTCESVAGDITLLGSSMGGYLAALYAENQPRVVRLVLLAPAFRFVTRYAQRISEMEMNDWKNNGYLDVYHYGYGEMRRLHYGIIEDARHYDRMELRRKLPTLVIHGLHDDTVPYQLSIDYLGSNPDARLYLLPSDHGMSTEIAEIWIQIQQFLFVNTLP